MFEQLATGAIGHLLTQGTGWIVAVLLGFVVFLQDKRVALLNTTIKLQADAYNITIQEHFEKRLKEFREIVDVMSNSTTTVGTMHTSVTATTDAINQLAAGFAKLLTEFQGQQTRWDDRGGNMLKQLDDIRDRLEDLQRGRAA